MKYDVVTPIEVKGRTHWHKIGRAWSDDPNKICIVLDSVPFRSEFIYLLKQDRPAEEQKK